MTSATKKSFVVLVIVALLAGFLAIAPWAVWLERALVNVAHGQGYSKAELHITRLDKEGITLTGVALEGEMSIALSVVEVTFFPLTLKHASMDFHGGTVTVDNVPLPLYARTPVDATLNIQHVSLDELLTALTGERATATGRVSGKLPVTLNVDNTVTVHKGNLKAETPGKIVMKPEAIPGDNEKLAVVRGVMQNLNYQLLSVDLDTDPQGKLATTLHIVGSNPDLYEGRQVNLNVTLTGDVLELIQQSLLTLDPQKLLEQSQHEK